ncbi:MAG TPA: outer membrane beta-barrel protein [Saprospiraceae bacterium]|nr:outer membrane beta-barrel protein [Saprospiraceae bacterium]
MHRLFGYKIVFTAVSLFCFTMTMQGQFSARDNVNYLDFQSKRYYFGMSFGANFSKFRVIQSNALITNEQLQIVESAPQGGFNIHLISNLKMGEYFDFRFNPGFAFMYRSLIYNNSAKKEIESVYFETPFNIRFKSAPYKDKRAFVMAGVKYGYDVASNSKSRRSENLIKLSPHDFQWEAGIGVQLYYPFFIFSPEIKISRGLGNSLIYNRNLPESIVLDKINSSIVTISFNFEG